MSNILLQNFGDGEIWVPCVCTDATYTDKFSKFILVEYTVINNRHVGFCKLCNRSHSHAPVWNSVWDGNPTFFQHKRSCIYPGCTIQESKNHDMVSTTVGVSNPTSLHKSDCNHCNVSFESNHQNFTWSVASASTNPTWSNTICEFRRCTDCNRLETNGHTWGLQIVDRIGVEHCTYAGDGSNSNPPLDPANAQHRITHRCQRCNRSNHNISPNPQIQNHTMGPWTPWYNNSQHGCSRTRTCTVVGCGQSQYQNVSHQWSGSNCTRCGLTNAPQCYITGQHNFITQTYYWKHWSIPDLYCYQIIKCSYCGCTASKESQTHDFTITVPNAPASTKACRRCGVCNKHWNNNAWTNNGINEKQAGTCSSPSCTQPAPIHYRGHTWRLGWERNSTQHWQICNSCPTNNRAERNRASHDFGNWFFWNQDNDICQRRFESCICGQPNLDVIREHIYDEHDKCTRPGCTWNKEVIEDVIEWCPFCNGTGCSSCKKDVI